MTVMGDTFRGKYIPVQIYLCLVGMNHTVTDLCECADATVAAGHEMFDWEDSACNSYPNGIPDDWPACIEEEGKKMYSIDVSSSNLYTLDNLDSSVGSEDITMTWDNLDGHDCFVAYRVELNNEIKIVYETTARFSRFNAENCVSFPVTVTPIDPVTMDDKGDTATSKVFPWCELGLPDGFADGQ